MHCSQVPDAGSGALKAYGYARTAEILGHQPRHSSELEHNAQPFRELL